MACNSNREVYNLDILFYTKNSCQKVSKIPTPTQLSYKYFIPQSVPNVRNNLFGGEWFFFQNNFLVFFCYIFSLNRNNEEMSTKGVFNMSVMSHCLKTSDRLYVQFTHSVMQSDRNSLKIDTFREAKTSELMNSENS